MRPLWLPARVLIGYCFSAFCQDANAPLQLFTIDGAVELAVDAVDIVKKKEEREGEGGKFRTDVKVGCIEMQSRSEYDRIQFYSISFG